MKKLGCLLVALVILAFLALFGADMAGGAIVKAAVEKGGPKVLKVPVTLETASVGLLGGRLEMTNLKVDNPAGFSKGSFLSLGKFEMKAKWLSFLSKEVQLPELAIEDMTLFLESKGVASNLQFFLAALQSKEASQEGPGIRIGRLSLKRIKVKGSLEGLVGSEVSLADIEIANPGQSKHSDGSAPKAAEILSEVFLKIAENINKAGLKLDFNPGTLLKGLGDIKTPEDLTKPFENILKNLPK